LLPEHEILQNKIPAVMEEANQGSDPEKTQAEHGTELYRISDWKYDSAIGQSFGEGYGVMTVRREPVDVEPALRKP
jgi:hypothetical protein